MMTNGDPEGWIFISRPHMNKRFFSCSSLNNTFYVYKRFPEVPDYPEMRHDDITLI